MVSLIVSRFNTFPGLTRITLGKSITLSEEAEEVAGFFAALLETDHAADKTFRKNFFEDWLKVLKEHPSVRPRSLFDSLFGQY
jgi:DNA topoisomerase IB